MGIRCADHVTPLYPQKLALTSPTGGGRSVGIIRSRTKATEFSFSFKYTIHKSAVKQLEILKQLEALFIRFKTHGVF